MDPLVPTAGEAAVLGLGILTVILWAVALWTLSRDRRYTPTQRLLWLLAIVAAPIVGSALWLLLGRRPGTDRVPGPRGTA
ncbi:PLD nuclease N-terminal domain-containing protein [Kocuria marina]|uniref:PLD nuclease N-terminal domain-containing protein n=1 Tax=Kocuria marina TaxID=223184 RepID=UPI0022E504FF|nr:PLD nuclease N-terminal domain-containing protein [Kocuria marina]